MAQEENKAKLKVLTPEEMGVLQPDPLPALVASGRVQLLKQPQADEKKSLDDLTTEKITLAPTPVPLATFRSNFNLAVDAEAKKQTQKIQAEHHAELDRLMRETDRKVDSIRGEYDAKVLAVRETARRLDSLGERLEFAAKSAVFVTSILCGLVFGLFVYTR